MYEMKIKNFTDLYAWKEAYKLAVMIYKVTNGFPQKETFALVSQMRRAAVSISSNIAEGFSRRTRKEKIQFYSMSLGSLTELQNQILIAEGVSYLSIDDRKKLYDQSTCVQKIVHGLIKGTNKIHNT